MRELTLSELEQTSGGLIFGIPIAVMKMAGWLTAGTAVGFGANRYFNRRSNRGGGNAQSCPIPAATSASFGG